MSNAHGHPGPSFVAGRWLAAVRDLAIILVCALLALGLVAEIADETRRPGRGTARAVALSPRVDKRQGGDGWPMISGVKPLLGPSDSPGSPVDTAVRVLRPPPTK